MDNDKFIQLCKEKVVDYANTTMNLSSINKPVHISASDVYVVWLNRTLQNNKALLSSATESILLSAIDEISRNSSANVLAFGLGAGPFPRSGSIPLLPPFVPLI